MPGASTSIRGLSNHDQVPASPQSKFSRWNENKEEADVHRDENGQERVRLIDKIRMIKEKRHGVKPKPRKRTRDFRESFPVMRP